MKPFLTQAFDLAHQIDPHKTSPNPRVGCIIVDERQEIIATGTHKAYGGSHAEASALHALATQKYTNWDSTKTEALFSIEPLLQNKIIYITLEPCDCFSMKQTPSCTDLIIYHQPKKIVIGSVDPLFAGKNIQRLRSAGIEVIYNESHENSDEQILLNPFFPQRDKPYICLKLAATLDGKINVDSHAYSRGKSYISNQSSRQLVQTLRAQYSGILTTTKTVLNDDPRFTCRLKSFQRTFSDPALVVIGETPIPKEAQIFSTNSPRKIHQIPTEPLSDILRHCRQELKLDSLLIEAGADIASKLLQQNLVDEILFFVCPFIAGKGLNAFTQTISLNNFKRTTMKSLDGDIVCYYKKH